MTTSITNYSSPIKKLVRFFKSSRDRWKAKCIENKRVVRDLKGTIHDVSKSRDRWRSEATELRNQMVQMQQELEAIKNL